MNNILSGCFICLIKQRGYLVLFIFGTLTAVVLGVISAINFGDGLFTINLDNIAYIRFLKDDCGFMSMFFGLFLSLCIFFLISFVCAFIPFLVPISVLFYLDLVYSQVVIFVSIILIYGILNCIILAILLLVYCLMIWAIFIVLSAQLKCFTNSTSYFKSCCDMKNSAVLICGILLIVLTFIFSLILLVLKNYVILLVF